MSRTGKASTLHLADSNKGLINKSALWNGATSNPRYLVNIQILSSLREFAPTHYGTASKTSVSPPLSVRSPSLPLNLGDVLRSHSLLSGRRARSANVDEPTTKSNNDLSAARTFLMEPTRPTLGVSRSLRSGIETNIGRSRPLEENT